MFTRVLPNKFRNQMKFFISFVCRQVLQKILLSIFFVLTISKLLQFTPLSFTNIPSQRELLITSANFSALFRSSTGYLRVREFRSNLSMTLTYARAVIDLNSMREFKFYRKTSIVFIICEHGSK